MWKLDDAAGPPAWRAAAPDRAALLAFSTRRGGVSAGPFESLNLGRSTGDRPEHVAENRRRLLESLGFDAACLATAGQVHGARVVEVEAPSHSSGCDALLTRVPRVVLAVTAADCVPLLYHAPGAVAAAHAGWRGIGAGLPGRALAAVREAADAPFERVHVHLGPCIRTCCYVVGPDVARRFPASTCERRGERWHLDLALAVRLQLLEAGLSPDALHDTGACTACAPDWYFSHRRDRGVTGRHWGLAALRG